MPEISIIIPAYNIEKYITKCIESVLSQTFESLEVIVVDDGSPDSSGKIADSYAEKDSRVKVIHKPNGGLSSARNAGIAVASGRYIMTVDGDDFISPRMCEMLYKAITESDSDMAVCSIKNITDSGDTVAEEDDACPISDGVLSPEQYRDGLLRRGSWYYVVAWNKLYKKEIFSEVQYPVGKIHEDEYTIHRIIGRCRKIACVSERLYNYVHRTGSITNSGYSVKRLEAIAALFDRSRFYLQSGVEHSAVSGNTVAAIKVLYESYGKADMKNAEFKQRYKQLHSELRSLIKPVLGCRMSIVYRLFLIANYFSPRMVYKLIKY